MRYSKKRRERVRVRDTKQKETRSRERKKGKTRAPSIIFSLRSFLVRVIMCACATRGRDQNKSRCCCVRDKGEKIFLKNATREVFEIKRSQRERERERERSRISHARYTKNIMFSLFYLSSSSEQRSSVSLLRCLQSSSREEDERLTTM